MLGIYFSISWIFLIEYFIFFYLILASLCSGERFFFSKRSLTMQGLSFFKLKYWFSKVNSLTNYNFFTNINKKLY